MEKKFLISKTKVEMMRLV